MNNSGFVHFSFGMNVANSEGSSTSHVLNQLPGIQQIFTQNAPVKPSGISQNLVQQTILPVQNSQPAANQTVVADQNCLQFVGQPVQGYINQQQQQQLLAQQAANTQQILGSRGIYSGNYQLMPRNYAVVNQGVQGSSLTVQLSPQQVGAGLGTGSPLEQPQGQFIQSAGFDPQLANLQQQNHQPIAFQSPTGQLMIQSPTQQIMLQSPNQFTLQSPTPQYTVQNQSQFTLPNQSIAQFNPQQHLLAQAQGQNILGQGQNVFVQGQNGGMIFHGEGILPHGVNQGVFMQSPGMVQNLNQPVYGTSQSVLTTPIPGMFSQSQMLANQNMGIISINHSPTGSENFVKQNLQNSSTSITNQQMQLLAQIANHGHVESVIGNQDQSLLLHQTPNSVNSENQNSQSLPSFGHFLLHHHMQSLPHPFLQNFAINSVCSQPAVITCSSADSNVSRTLIGVPSQTATFLTNQSAPCTSSVASVQTSTSLESNLNAEFNSWNMGQFSNQVRMANHNAVLKHSNSKGADKQSVPKLCSKSVAVSTSVTVTSVVVTTLSDSVAKTTASLKLCTAKVKCSSAVHRVTSTQSASIGSQSTNMKQGSVTTSSYQPRKEGEIEPVTVVVPYGWVRALEGDSIVYYSPTCTRLTSAESVRQYLVADGTCKCGLECPFHLEKVFNFNTNVVSIRWTPSVSSIKDTGKLCNHKRKYPVQDIAPPFKSLVSRSDVSMVTSSTMMSPRVSSTVQELDTSTACAKRQKLSKNSTSNSAKGETSVIDSVAENSEVSVNKTEDKDIGTGKIIEENKKKHSDKVGIKTAEGVCEKIDKSDCKQRESVCDAKDLDNGKSKVKISTEGHVKSETDHNATVSKKDSHVTKNVLKGNKSQECCPEITSSTNVKEKPNTTELIHNILRAAKSEMKSPQMSEKKVSPPKSKSPAKSRSRSSTGSKAASTASSPGSDRSSSRHSDPAVSPRRDTGLSADMFTQFMNICGVNPASLPPVFQQNFARVYGAKRDVAVPLLQTADQRTLDHGKQEILKQSALTQHKFGPAEANVLANLHKLSSPPNQQIFPLNMPGLNIRDPPSYQHGVSTSQPLLSPLSSKVQSLVHSSGSQLALSSLFPDGSIPQMSDFVWLSPDGKGKNAKESKKLEPSVIDSMFDSTPPPNVDVSILKDKGHGPIPKDKIVSFNENPSEYLKQQTDIVTSSISSSAEPKKQEDVDVGEKERSESACSDRLNSPFKPDSKDDTRTSAVSCSPGSIIDTVLKKSVSQKETRSVSVDAVGMSSEKSEALPTVMVPVASAPPTPTTIVHHTPGSLSCHQMSLLKARQHKLGGDKDSKPDPARESLLQPLAAILSDPTIGQVFQQMFPEVVQEALMYSLQMQNLQKKDAAGLNASPWLIPGKPGSLRLPHPLELVQNVNVSSATQTVNLEGSCRPTFSIQQMLNNLPQGEFPASTLLSAAAKAKVQPIQQPSIHVLSEQTPSISVSTVCSVSLPATVSTSNSALISQMLATPVTASAAGNITLSSVPAEKVKPKLGAQKISEILNRNEQNKQVKTSQHELDMLKFIEQLQKQEAVGHLQNIQSSNLLKLQSSGHVLPSHFEGHMASSAVVGPIPGSMNHTFGNPVGVQSNGTLFNPASEPVSSASMGIPQPVQQQFGVPLPENIPAGSHLQSIVQPHDQNVNVIPNLQHFLPLFASGNANQPPVNMLSAPQFASIQALIQQQALLGQSQPPLQGTNIQLQQLGTQQVALSNTMSNPVQQQLFRRSNPGTNSNAPSVMNLLNIQQSIGSGTQLTAMQIQTLHLQQQLLQQLQQVQGMQHLINQYNLQNVASTAPAVNRQQESVTAPVEAVGAVTASAQVAPVLSSVSVTNVAKMDGVVTEITPGSDKKVGEGTKSKNIRVIAAADTTDDCTSATKTVDIGTETDAIDDDNGESEIQSESEEGSGEEQDSVAKSEVESGDSSDDTNDNEDTAPDEDTNATEGDDYESDSKDDEDKREGKKTTKEEPVRKSYSASSSSSPPSSSLSSSAFSRLSSLNTCLAIATQKGTSRSGEYELKSLGEKSSLARSQNLAAELSRPMGGELKLKIKRKFVSSDETIYEPVKKIKPKAKRTTHFERKELRSSTQAATKASSSLAAFAIASKETSKPKDDQSEEKSKDLGNNKTKLPCSIDATSMAKEIHRKAEKKELSFGEFECDSSVDASHLVQSPTKESPKKDNLTSQIAAALSSQKGLWQLSKEKKKILPNVPDGKDLKFEVQAAQEVTTEVVPVSSTELIDTGESQEALTVVSRSFSTGDLVWGQIRGFPSWPGKLVDRTDPKCGVTEEGKVYVKWFGDNTVTQVETEKLKTLSEGLEAHHRARKKHRKGRKMNSNLEQAIQQAMSELDRQTSALSEKKEQVTMEKGTKLLKVKQKK